MDELLWGWGGLTEKGRRRMIDINDSIMCCGVREIGGLHGTAPGDAANEVAEYIWPSITDSDRERAKDDEEHFAFVIFTGIVGVTSGREVENYGAKFRAYIRENRLGMVTEGPERENPNTGNTIRVWVWAINHTNLFNHARKSLRRQLTKDRVRKGERGGRVG